MDAQSPKARGRPRARTRARAKERTMLMVGVLVRARIGREPPGRLVHKLAFLRLLLILMTRFFGCVRMVELQWPKPNPVTEFLAHAVID